MKHLTTFPHLLRRDSRGSAAVEFAFAAPVVVTLVVGVLEFGMILLVTVLLESGLRDASRYGITGLEGTGENRIEAITRIVTERTLGLIDMASATFEVVVYPTFDTVGQGEDFVDGNGNGAYDDGETYTDSNGNGAWDADVGQPGAGDAGDVVVYRIRYDWPLMTALGQHLVGTGGKIPVGASLAVRNEPWNGSGG